MRPTNQLDQWEWIEAYHRGTLSAGERLAVEEEFARDATFRQTADQLRMADQALRVLALTPIVREAIESELNLIEQPTSQNEPKQVNKPLRRLRLGRLAGVLLGSLLLGIGYFTFSRVDLAAYRQDVTLTQDYRDLNADQGLSELTPQQRAFYRELFDAQAYLTNGQPQLAIPKLTKLAGSQSIRPYFKQAVQWHLLNAYLLNHQPDNAEATFQLLNQEGTLVYPINWIDRCKIWWQIRWQKLSSTT